MQPEVGQALDVGVPAQRVHAAAGDADVAQQQLHHRAAADHLRADRSAASSRARTGSSWRASASAVEAIISQTFRNLSFGVPQMRSTISGV